MESLCLPVIHPAIQKLKLSGSWLHLLAGLLILIHALSHLNGSGIHPVFLWCQVLIALDIIILVFAGRGLLASAPRINLFFRLEEVVFFAGIGIIMMGAGAYFSGIFHFCLSLSYLYLCYCERLAAKNEVLCFYHTGITLPGIPRHTFMIWTHINRVEAYYDSIRIETSSRQVYHFGFRKNLDYQELEQIHEFCRHYL